MAFLFAGDGSEHASKSSNVLASAEDVLNRQLVEVNHAVALVRSGVDVEALEGHRDASESCAAALTRAKRYSAERSSTWLA